MKSAAGDRFGLYLAGIIKLADHGFAFPCFARQKSENTWYYATSDPTGDHNGSVVSFEPFEVSDLILLPRQFHRLTQIGDAWCDVFLWSDHIYVGTPAELWDKLEPHRAAIAEGSPLTLLDLASCVAGVDINPIALTAFDFLARQFCSAVSERWRDQTYLRGHLVRNVRSTLRSKAIDPEIRRLVQDLQIFTEMDGTAHIFLPKKLLDELRHQNFSDDSLVDLRGAAQAFGLCLKSVSFLSEESVIEERRSAMTSMPVGWKAGGAPKNRNVSGYRRIVLCADDYGISPAVNAAIRDLIVRRRLNATSVMVVAPSFHRSEAITLDRQRPTGVAIGLHLTLSEPFKPLSEGATLTRDGVFLPLREMLTRATLRRLDYRALEAEVRSQIRMFMHSFGRPPDFIDGHQHVQLFPQVRDAVLKVTRELAPHAWVRQCGSIAPWTTRVRDRKGLLLDMLSKGFRASAEAADVPTNPAFAGTYAFDEGADFATLFPRFLDGLPDGSVVMCHPGMVDAELRRLDPLTDLREREYAFLSADIFPKLLARHGVSLA